MRGAWRVIFVVAVSVALFLKTNSAAIAAPNGEASPVVAVYGHSVKGIDLVSYTFGDGPNKTAVIACIHGNERNTRPLAERLVSYLESHPNIYAGCTVTVIPCANPDGWARGTRVNARGVDLNRNFPIGWHGNVPGKLKRGASPLSEPEAASLAGLIERLRPAKIVSIHNPLHMLDWSGAKGEQLATVISAHDHYPVPTGGVGYPTPGSFGQFASRYSAAIVTLELPRESVDAAWQQNRDALTAVIVSPIGTSALSAKSSRSAPR